MRASRYLLALLFSAGCREATEQPRPVPSSLAEQVLAAAPSELKHPVRIEYESRLELLGYELEPAGTIGAGTKVTLTLFWRCLRSLEPGWSLFTELLDVRGRPIGVPELEQAGALRQELSTSGYDRGKVYVDRLEFELPRGLDTPEVTLVAGVRREVMAPPTRGEEASAKPSVETRLRVVSGPSVGPDRGLVARFAVAKGPGAPAPSASRGMAPDELNRLLGAFR